MKKKIITDSSGITIVSLIITIVILSLLASAATYAGVDVIEKARVKKFTIQMQILQTQVNNINSTKKEFDENDGEEITSGSIYYEQLTNRLNLVSDYGYGKTEEDIQGYRYFTEEDLKEDLGIDGVGQSVFINLKENKVISVKGVKQGDTRKYVLEQVSDEIYMVNYEGMDTETKPTFDVNVTPITGQKKWNIEISNIQHTENISKWIVQYKLEDAENWSTSNSLNFIVDVAGNYIIRIRNNDIVSEEKNFVIENQYISDGLILHLDAINNTGDGDEAHSTIADEWKDLSGNENNATLIGNPIWQDKCIYFDGETSYATINNIIKDMQEFSIEFIYSSKQKKSWQYYWGITANKMGLESNAEDKRAVYYDSGKSANFYSIIPSLDIPVNSTITFSKDKIKAYLNGENQEIADNETNVIYSTSGDKFGIGADGNGDYKAKVDYYGFRIYNRLLTDEEIKNNYKVDKVRFNLE